MPRPGTRAETKERKRKPSAEPGSNHRHAKSLVAEAEGEDWVDVDVPLPVSNANLKESHELANVSNTDSFLMNSEPSNRSGDAEDAVSIRTATTMSESDFIIPEGKSPINMSKQENIGEDDKHAMTHDEASEKIAENVSKEVGIGPSADRYVIVMEKRTGKEKSEQNNTGTLPLGTLDNNTLTSGRRIVHDELNHAADDLRADLKVALEGFGKLRDVETCTNMGGNNMAMPVPTVSFPDWVHDEALIRRIYSLANIRGTNTLQNFGMMYPEDYVITRGYIRRRNPPGVGNFFVIGTTCLSALVGGETKKNRQLCIRPMWETFRRGIASTGTIIKESALYLPSYEDGVSFSSMVYKEPSEDQAGKGRGGNAEQFRSRYSNVYSPCVPPGIDIAIYDARNDQFSLASYTSRLKRSTTELEKNSVVVVTFTLGAYSLKAERVPDGGPSDLNMALSFNVKDVILLADNVGPIIAKPLSFTEPWGVVTAEEIAREGSPSSDTENIPPLEPAEALI